ncbi:DUF4190 domain-containing protein [Spirillospora sp. CA-253888]
MPEHVPDSPLQDRPQEGPAPWGAAPWGPPSGPRGPFPPPRQAGNGNGLGVAALVLGVVGVVLGLVPFLFWLSGTFGVLALVFGLIGHSRAGKGQATNKGMALAGNILGGLALVLAIIGVVLTVMFVEAVNRSDDSFPVRRGVPSAVPSPSASLASTGPPAPSTCTVTRRETWRSR